MQHKPHPQPNFRRRTRRKRLFTRDAEDAEFGEKRDFTPKNTKLKNIYF
jgi:hypothetical protein